MQVYRSSLARCIASPHVRFNSTDVAKSNVQRLAASWDDIHIPSRKEVKQAQKTGSLSSRLAARRPHPSPASTTVTSPSPTPDAPVSPKLVPVASGQETIAPHKNPSQRRVHASPTSVKKPDVTLQSAADTLNDLFQDLPNLVSPVQNSWEKGLEAMNQNTKSSPKAKKVKVDGRSWTPEAGSKITGRVATTAVTRNAGASARKENDKRSSRTIEDFDNMNEENSTTDPIVEDDEDAEIYLDDTVIDGVSLLAPRPGQSTQLWYESILQQNREPEGARVIYPDIDISSDFHGLFGVGRAEQRSIMVSNLGALRRDRPAATKGKVEYQVRKVMRRYGGDYSHLQPSLVPTDLRRKMRPSQLARLNMSRRNEASAEQRKTFDSLISSTLRDTNTVKQAIRA
ncbi:hypothetical protein GGU10DRAFT_431817 [Lentinula aff. detonsa]|uniref:Uncharacterized protein n=1 Tax=Lentinula aff. detonsa TaxID=2804958 RepID=A0AA38NQF1_9AGAR|nr:hypothetical protein GGU10DRAFT_431817 [Lentinula aff. detonsa]